MKKSFSVIFILLQFVFPGNGQNLQQDLESILKHSCLHYVEPTDREKYLKNYNNLYRTIDSSVHTSHIDFPVSYIKFMAKFYEDNQDYDGLRINMGNFYRNPHDQDKKQIMLMFSPTRDKIADSTAFKHYRKQKLNKQEFRKIDINPLYEGNKKKNRHFITHGAYKFNKYKKAYRKNYLNSCLYTTSMFICKDNIFLLNKLFLDKPEYDKIRFEFISYNEIKVDSQCSPYQISLLLTPVKNGNPDPAVLKTYVSDASKNKVQDISILSINHGELCPFKCN